MTDEIPARPVSKWPVLIALGIFMLVTGVFIYEFLISSEETGGIATEDISEDTYAATAQLLLTGADPARGAELVEEKGCNACHAGPNAGRLAPPHAEVAAFAAERRPPLTAPAYVYEAIVFPGEFVVDGYQNNMPRVYAEQLTDEELGDIIAYLLTADTDGR